MLTAVSALSPVSTHTWMPASRSAKMVSGTLSWRRSSMPVAPARPQETQGLSRAGSYAVSRCFLVLCCVWLPSSVRSVSSSAALSLTSSSLFSIAASASRLVSDQLFNAASVTTWSTHTHTHVHTMHAQDEASAWRMRKWQRRKFSCQGRQPFL